MNAGEEALRTTLSRRRLLQAAVMGVSAAALGAKVGDGAAGESSYGDEVEIVSGRLLQRGDEWLDIEQGERPRRVPLTQGTTFWKGGATGPLALTQGDDVMARLARPSVAASRVWSNLSRRQGRVTKITPSGYVLITTALHAPGVELLVQVTEATLLAAGDGSPLGLDWRIIEPDDYLDVIGESISDGLRATLVWPTRAKSVPTSQPATLEAPAATPRPVGPLALCTYQYRGYAGWFDCPTGTGRCRTCSTSSSAQTAWPAFDSCGCCNPNCCDCSTGCKNQIRISCGAQVRVSDSCSGRLRTVTVVTCGPCQRANCGGCAPDLCSRPCSDCGRTDVSPVVDLTRPTFAYFYDPALRGCFPCVASYSTIC